jgi:hypothetical protein
LEVSGELHIPRKKGGGGDKNKTTPRRQRNGRTFIFISLFSLILFSSFLGLYLYIFTRTGHSTMILSPTLPLSVRFIIFG